MNELFATIETVLNKLYEFIAKVFGIVDGFTNTEENA